MDWYILEVDYHYYSVKVIIRLVYLSVGSHIHVWASTADRMIMFVRSKGQAFLSGIVALVDRMNGCSMDVLIFKDICS